MPGDQRAAECPECQERCRVERLAHGWWFCAACGAAFLIDSDGKVIHRAITNHYGVTARRPN